MIAEHEFFEYRKRSRELYKEGRYHALFELLHQGVQKGDPVCMRDLGWSYYKGDSGDVDLERAMEWFSKAAEHGEPGGWYGMGAVRYEREQYAEALEDFEKAASMEWPVAARWAGMMYEQGIGVDKDYEQAERCYRRSAAQGNLRAKRLLAGLWLHGHGGLSGRLMGSLYVVSVFFQTLVIAFKDETSEKLK